MAEHSFREVMHEVNRLCMAMKNCDPNCPLGNMGCCGNLGTHCSDPLQSERIENTVMAWAAEHPVVYPTWADYISTLVIKDICTGKISGPDTVLTYAMKTHIPADIAEKLGIEPKEDA